MRPRISKSSSLQLQAEWSLHFKCFEPKKIDPHPNSLIMYGSSQVVVANIVHDWIVETRDMKHVTRYWRVHRLRSSSGWHSRSLHEEQY